MELIKSMAASGCFIGIAVCAADILKPDERFASHIRFVFSIIFLIAFLTPLIKSDTADILKDAAMAGKNIEYTDIDKAARTDMKNFIEKNTERSLGEIFEENDIKYSMIDVSVTVDESSHVELCGISICTENNGKAERLLRNELGEEVPISCIDHSE